MDETNKFLRILEDEGIKLYNVELEEDKIIVKFNKPYDAKYKNLIRYAANAAGVFKCNFYIIEKALLYENLLKAIEICSF